MPNYTYPGVPDDRLFDHVIEQARAAEAAGFDLVTVMDHLYQIRGVGPETDPMLEAYTTLAAIAAQTNWLPSPSVSTNPVPRGPLWVVNSVTARQYSEVAWIESVPAPGGNGNRAS